MADHLDSAIACLGLAPRITGQHAACSGLSIDSVGLAVPASELPVDQANLDDAHAQGGQSPRETGTVGSGPFDANGMDGAMAACPVVITHPLARVGFR